MSIFDGRGPVSGRSGRPGDDWTNDDLGALLERGRAVADHVDRLIAAHQAGLSDEQIRQLARLRRQQRQGEGE